MGKKENNKKISHIEKKKKILCKISSKKKSFTLIELLIVIAIIGVLSSVVLAALNLARAKGANASIKLGMSNMISQAEIYYDDSFQSYVGVCIDPKFSLILASASSTGGGTGNCADNLNAWAVYVQLKVPDAEGSYWCVNNKGISRAISAIPDIWETSSCELLEWYANDTPAEEVNWAAGGTACAGLSSVGGIKDGMTWRLPSRDELFAKYDEIDSTPPGYQSNFYWSGTTSSADPNFAYNVDMDNRNVDTDDKVTSAFYVRCVR